MNLAELAVSLALLLNCVLTLLPPMVGAAQEVQRVVREVPRAYQEALKWTEQE